MIIFGTTFQNVIEINVHVFFKFQKMVLGIHYTIFIFVVVVIYLSDLQSCLYYLLNALYNKFTNYYFALNPVKVFGSIHIENFQMDGCRWIVFRRKDRTSAHSFCGFSGVFLIAAVFFAKRLKINKKTPPLPNRRLLTNQLSYKGYTDLPFVKLGITLVAHFLPNNILTRFWL